MDDDNELLIGDNETYQGDSPVHSQKRREFRGVGGWLIIFIIFTGILFPLALFINTSGWEKNYPHIQHIDGIKLLVAADVAAVIFFGAFGIYLSLSLLARRPNAVTLVKAFLVIYILVSTVLWVMILKMELPKGITTYMDRWIIVRFVFSLVWFTYFLKSRRIRATFEQESQERSGSFFEADKTENKFKVFATIVMAIYIVIAAFWIIPFQNYISKFQPRTAKEATGIEDTMKNMDQDFLKEKHKEGPGDQPVREKPLPPDSTDSENIEEESVRTPLEEDPMDFYNPEIQPITPPRLIEKGKIEYPEFALKLKAQGKVIVEFTINVEGKAENIKVASVSPAGLGFEEAAVKYINGCRWEPGRRNNKPISSHSMMPIVFKLQ